MRRTSPPTATSVPTSLWQQNLVGYRLTRFVSWGAAPNAVQVFDDALAMTQDALVEAFKELRDLQRLINAVEGALAVGGVAREWHAGLTALVDRRNWIAVCLAHEDASVLADTATIVAGEPRCSGTRSRRAGDALMN